MPVVLGRGDGNRSGAGAARSAVVKEEEGDGALLSCHGTLHKHIVACFQPTRNQGHDHVRLRGHMH